MNESRAFQSLCAHFGISSQTPDDALTELAERMNKSSNDLSILMHYMRETEVSIYRLSQNSGLSVSAVKNRLSNEDAHAEMSRIIAGGKDKDYALVDLSQLSDAARAEVQAAQIKDEA